MGSVKEELLTMYMNEIMERFNGDDLKFLKEKFWGVAYNFSINKIKSTEISTTNGETTERLFQYFRIGKLSSGKSEDTINQYRRVVYQLCDFCNKEINMITTDDVLSFLTKYKKLHNIKESTMDSKRKYLSSVFTYLTKHKKLNENPMDLVEPVKYRKCVKIPLSDEEIEMVKINCANARDLAIIQFSLDTGVRVSELCGINLSDIDFKNYTCKVIGKGNKERIVPFSGKTMIRINEYLKQRKDINFNGAFLQYDNNTPLFKSFKRDDRIYKNGVECMMRKLGLKSGVIRLHPHLLRATFATRLAEKGVDIGMIAKLLGHANLGTIDRYVLIDQNRIENIVRQKGFCS